MDPAAPGAGSAQRKQQLFLSHFPPITAASLIKEVVLHHAYTWGGVLTALTTAILTPLVADA